MIVGDKRPIPHDSERDLCGIFKPPHHNSVPPITSLHTKHSLMKLPSIITNLLAIIFFGMVSYGLTGSIAVKSTIGIILALIGLGAGIVFLCLLPKLYRQPAEEERAEG